MYLIVQRCDASVRHFVRRACVCVCARLTNDGAVLTACCEGLDTAYMWCVHQNVYARLIKLSPFAFVN